MATKRRFSEDEMLEIGKVVHGAVEEVERTIDRKIYLSNLSNLKPMKARLDRIEKMVREMTNKLFEDERGPAIDSRLDRVEESLSELIKKAVDEGRKRPQEDDVTLRLKNLFEETKTSCGPERHMVTWGENETRDLKKSIYVFVQSKSALHKRLPSGIMYRIVKILKEAGVDLAKVQ